MTPATIAISGYSGSGKTTLMEKVVASLRRSGLAVGVVKHDAHRLVFDTPGKDSYRLRQAGADRVEAFDDGWWFQVAPRDPELVHGWLPPGWRQDLDVLVVEGGKTTDEEKIWLRAPGGEGPPAHVTRVLADVTRSDEAPAVVEGLIRRWLRRWWDERPRSITLLAGGRNMERLRRHLHLARSFCTDVTVVDAPGRDPEAEMPLILPSVPDARGDLAGMLARLRFVPAIPTMVIRADDPAPSDDRLQGIWNRRRPGVWTVLADDAVVLEPQAAHVLERLRARGESDATKSLSTHTRTVLFDRGRDA